VEARTGDAALVHGGGGPIAMISPRRASSELAALVAELQRHGARARADSGVGTLRQLIELVRLRLGPGKLSPDDYYRMRVYRRDLTFEDKLQFLSQRAVHLPKRWNIVAHDKLLAYIVLAHEGIRIPRVTAICHPLRSHGQVPVLRSADDVCVYLRESTSYPFIAKPITGVFSQDVHLVESIDRETDTLRCGDGEVKVGEFARKSIDRVDGTLFQELLKPHRDIAARVSTRLCTLRLIVVLEGDGVRLFRAFWKVAGAANFADNYWRPGNFIARLDARSGEVLECVTGLGPDFRTLTHHPATGATLAGFTVPMFTEAVALALRAAPAFPGMKMQAWDIAITDEGPVALEVNEEGSVFLPQLVDGRGMNDQSFQDFRSRALH
jgi:hypothetical protein